MTAAQVMAARVPSAPPPPRAKDDGAVGQSGKNGGFEETLDLADASQAEAASGASQDTTPASGEPHDAGRQSQSMRGHGRGSETESLDETAPEPQADAASNQMTIAQTPAFVLALAALSASGLEPQAQPQGEAAATESVAPPQSDEAVLNTILSGPDAKPKTQDVKMPGAVDPMMETLSLLGISDDEAAGVQDSAEQITAKVIGQETHLAMSPKTSVTVEAYAGGAAQAAVAQAPVSKAAAQTAKADAQPQAGDTPAAVSPALSGEQAPVAGSAAAFSDEGSSSDNGSGQERRQAEGGQAQQSSPATQGALPAGAQGGSAMPVRTTATDTTFESFTDSLSPASQIARSVTSGLDDMDQSGSSTNGALKVLHIELKPANLGSVTVRMSLKDDVISLHMETSRHETAAAIEKERSALTGVLKSAGYVVDEITTQPMDVSRSAAGRIEAASNDASMSSSFAQGDGRSQAQQEFSSSGRGQGGQRGSNGDVSLTPANSAGEGATEVPRARTGAIYV